MITSKLCLRILVVGSLFLCFLLGRWTWWSCNFCFECYAIPPEIKWPPEGAVIRCPIVKDTFVSTVGKERFGNNGGSIRLKVKGQQEYTLFDIDPAPLKGKIITGGLFHIRSASENKAPLLRIGISTISSPWIEGSSGNYRPEVGSTCFAQAEYKRRDWSYKGSTLMDVVFGHGNTIWKFADCTPPDNNGWQTCAVEPDVISARVAGLSYGFCMADEVGHEWSIKNRKFQYRWFPNRFCYSRENKKSVPWLEVWTTGTDNIPPEKIANVEVVTKGFPSGEALVVWETPRDRGGGKTLGFIVEYQRKGGKRKTVPRYLVPMARAPGEKVRMHLHDISFKPGEKFLLSIRPVDSAGNIGDAFVRNVKVSSGSVPVKLSPKMPVFSGREKCLTVGGLKIAVLDLLDKVDPRTGEMIPAHGHAYKYSNHIFSSVKKLIKLYSARNEAVAFQVNLEGKAENIKVGLKFDDDPELHTKIYEFAYVATKSKFWGTKSYLPDPLVPLKGSFSIPSTAGYTRVPGQRNHSLICEIYVSHNISPGVKRGKLIVSANGETLVIDVNLQVWNFTLPNKLSFIPEMNAYGTVSPFKSYDYYRLAHEHRTCLNRLPYDWAGNVSFAPEWDGKKFKWSEWDKKVGPLLDGSAFKGLSREGEPVDVFYLPFNENWPVNIFVNYKPSYWADEAFTETYKCALGRAFSLFAKHCSEKKWHDTIFEFYLNNKVYFREKFWQCSAPWIFDEPVNTQDFWALRWYGLLWHQSVNPVMGLSKMWFRADISYTQFARNTLWGIADIEYLGGVKDQKIRMKSEELINTGRKSFYAEYGSPNAVSEPNIQPVLWCLLAWSRGAIGVLPWQAIGTKNCWKTAEKTSLFYPDRGGAKASVRLKAFRRGQQYVEYLTLFSKAYRYPKYAVVNWLKTCLPVDEYFYGHSIESDKMKGLNLDPVKLWRIRYLLGDAISRKKPPYRRALLVFETPEWSKKHISSIGYVSRAPKVQAAKPVCDSFVP